MFTRILVPTDGSELSLSAARYAAALAASLDAHLIGFHVIAPFHVFDLNPDNLEESKASYVAHAEARSAKALADWRAVVEAAGRTGETVSVHADDPYAAIVGAAHEHRCDLIVMASHGRRGMAALMLGSVTQKVLTHTTTPVLVVR